MLLERRRIGLVEDDPLMGESLVQRLELEGAKVDWWKSAGAASSALAVRSHNRDVVVCDIRLPDGSGEEVFRASAVTLNPPPFLFMTGFADVDQAVRLIRSGAGDYVPKPFDMTDFLKRLTVLVRDRSDPAEPKLGVSPSMIVLEKLLLRVAKANSNILLSGETGVGKEVCARYLHDVSATPDGPFIAVNCAAIPEELLESELFGHEKGAFSGAVGRHLGYAERASKGTLFLDEIGELSQRMQSKLLRLIENRTFTRVGGESALAFNGRLVCATNVNLQTAIKNGKFREDLYYRINVVSAEIPPLRNRPEDVLWLAERFLSEIALSQLCPAGLSAMAVDALISHAWPGNARELKNRLERAALLALGPWIMPGDLFPEKASGSIHAAWGDEPLGPLEQVRDEAERRHILRVLDSTKGAIIPAARLLRISRTTLWEKMRRHGIEYGETLGD